MLQMLPQNFLKKFKTLKNKFYKPQKFIGAEALHCMDDFWMTDNEPFVKSETVPQVDKLAVRGGRQKKYKSV
jgi:hypothetical protein